MTLPSRLIRGSLAALLLVAACERAEDVAPSPGDPPAVEFATGTVRIETEADTFRLSVEIAETDQQRSVGLMRRVSLPEDAGMIFLYDGLQGPEGSFWMFNTRIPLSIAFIDAEGHIAVIRDMEPCASPYPQWCPEYSAGVPFASALEANAGYFAARGIEPGARVVLER